MIDQFAYQRSYLINVGDEKGEILERAIRDTRPRLILELGTYCGYSGLRIYRSMPADARLVSVEVNPANAEIARGVWAHAGLDGRATVVVGSLGDGGATAGRLEAEHGFQPGSLDFTFIDHDKNAYLPDLQTILDREWLHPGSVVVADNLKIPGAPAYRSFMREHEGRDWRTVEHLAHAEYQTLFKDLVLQSHYQ